VPPKSSHATPGPCRRVHLNTTTSRQPPAAQPRSPKSEGRLLLVGCPAGGSADDSDIGIRASFGFRTSDFRPLRPVVPTRCARFATPPPSPCLASRHILPIPDTPQAPATRKQPPGCKAPLMLRFTHGDSADLVGGPLYGFLSLPPERRRAPSAAPGRATAVERRRRHAIGANHRLGTNPGPPPNRLPPLLSRPRAERPRRRPRSLPWRKRAAYRISFQDVMSTRRLVFSRASASS